MAEIERHRLVDGHCRGNDRDAVEGVAHLRAKRRKIMRPTRRQRPRQILMSDEGRAGLDEGAIAESMIGMGVGVDDVANELLRLFAQRREEGAAFDQAAARVDHRDRVVADDRSEIGDVARIFPGHEGSFALMGVNAGGDFA